MSDVNLKNGKWHQQDFQTFQKGRKFHLVFFKPKYLENMKMTADFPDIAFSFEIVLRTLNLRKLISNSICYFIMYHCVILHLFKIFYCLFRLFFAKKYLNHILFSIMVLDIIMPSSLLYNIILSSYKVCVYFSQNKIICLIFSSLKWLTKQQ